MNLLNTSVLLGAMLILSACGPSGVTIKDHRPSYKISGLKLDESQQPSIVYIRPDAPTLEAYNAFIIDPVRINYNDPAMGELEPESIAKMQSYFVEALTEELTDGGYKVVTRSGRGVLRISATISDLKAAEPVGTKNLIGLAATTALGAPGLVSVSVGEVKVETAFANTENNRIDAIVVSKAKGSHVMSQNAWSSWGDVEAAFEDWAEGIREAVDKAHQSAN